MEVPQATEGDSAHPKEVGVPSEEQVLDTEVRTRQEDLPLRDEGGRPLRAIRSSGWELL